MEDRERYTIREIPRLGIVQVIDTLESRGELAVMFAGLREDCEAWINDPLSRPLDKPVDYPFR